MEQILSRFLNLLPVQTGRNSRDTNALLGFSLISHVLMKRGELRRTLTHRLTLDADELARTITHAALPSTGNYSWDPKTSWARLFTSHFYTNYRVMTSLKVEMEGDCCSSLLGRICSTWWLYSVARNIQREALSAYCDWMCSPSECRFPTELVFYCSDTSLLPFQ